MKTEVKQEEIGIELEVPKTEEELIAQEEKKEEQNPVAAWNPRTQIGKEVKAGRIKDIDSILSSGKKILEPEIVDSLISLEKDLLLVGQSKGKFGGGKRRAWRQTQKKTMEGNVLTFSSLAVVGDRNGHVGIGLGKSKETLPSREKAVRLAKLNVIKVTRGCGNFDCSCSEPHSIPFIVEGKCGSVKIKLIPAPQGTGLVVGDECKKILRLAGIRDIYSYTQGYGRSTINFASACIEALKNTGVLK
ncbi:30S ribosomal protein S5 [Candidatus Pacearchaeota archaeon]|nr:30S ribosomal protein S5 [Candidatus Pacearchaeota archaeon]